MPKKIRTDTTVHTDTSIWRYLQKNVRGIRIGPSILQRYILKEILAPFGMALGFFTALFMAIVLKDIIGELIGKGISAFDLLVYLSYLILEKLTLTIPMACLLAGIMAAGRLSGDSEIVAMRSSGISFPRIYSVFLFMGFVSMLVVGFMNLYLGPRNAKAREDFEEDLKTYHSLMLVRPGRFLGGASFTGVSKTGQDIYAEKKTGGSLQQVQIREWYSNMGENSRKIIIQNRVIPIGDGFITQIAHARQGELMNRVSESSGKTEKIIRLKKGFLIELDDKQSRYEITDFSKGHMDYVIPPPMKALGRLNVRPDNYTFLELLDFLEKMEKGGNTIDLCSLNPECQAGGKSSKKMGAAGGSGTYTLPPISDMEKQVKEMQDWITANFNKIDKPGGPTKKEFQQRIQLSMTMMGFLKDAGKTKIKFEVEIQKRLAMPVACLIFFFVSFPLGLVVKRSGKGMSFTVAGVIFMTYFGTMATGLQQAYKGNWSAWVGAWFPDIVIAVIGVYVMSTRTDGFSPFKFLMIPFEFISRPIRRILGRHLEPVLKFIPLEKLSRLQAGIYGSVEKLTGWLAAKLKKMRSL